MRAATPFRPKLYLQSSPAVVQTAVLVMAVIYMLAFAVADVVQAVLDPRIRLS